LNGFIEEQSFLRSYDFPPASCLSFSLFPGGYAAGRAYERERGEGVHGRGAFITRPQESLALYESSTTLWYCHSQDSAYFVRSKGLRVAHLPSPKVLFFSVANMW
jgi:hypothetical protein